MELEATKLQCDTQECFGGGWFGTFQHHLWDLIEDPSSSWAARVDSLANLFMNFTLQLISILSLIFVVISTVVMTLNTLPMMQTVDKQGNVGENPNLILLESVCISWFTLEFLFR